MGIGQALADVGTGVFQMSLTQRRHMVPSSPATPPSFRIETADYLRKMREAETRGPHSKRPYGEKSVPRAKVEWSGSRSR